MSYTPTFKMHQKLESSLLDQRASRRYEPLQTLESRQLLFDRLEASDDAGFDCHKVRERSTASTLFLLYYGFRIKSSEDANLRAIHTIDDDFSEFVRVGSHPVDVFPFLNYLPTFMAPWKINAVEHWKLQNGLHIPNFKRGLDAPGWTAAKQAWEKVQNGELDFTLQNIAIEFGTMIDAALDGTIETLMWFLVACLTQDTGFTAKAQRELDEVVGRDRLPSFEDRSKLVYVSAIVEEVMRWRPAGAGGVPHFTKPESTYNGYRIPANSVVVPVHWAIGREEAVFGSNVEDFLPERWLDAGATDGNLKDLPEVNFGYGRRTCPGRHFARSTVWIAIARILWAFDVKHGRDPKTGAKMEVDNLAAIDGLLMRPAPFKVVFKPRGIWAREVVEKEGFTYGEDVTPVLSQIGEDLARRTG